ncbi:hypothetical protein BH23ACT3_BH23ACT3_22990 [soil metagenome]
MASWPPPSDLPPPVISPEHDGANVVVDEPGPEVRPGELTAGWSVVFGLGWLAVGVAMAAVWTASRQLGLSTWWLGPTADPRPIFVNVLPFVAPLLFVASAMKRVRYLPWFGLVGAAATAVVGIGDFGRVRGFGLVELLIAAAAAAVSLASFAGMYRRDVSR